MTDGKEMNHKERRKLKSTIVVDFVANVVDLQLEMMEKNFVIPDNVYEDLLLIGEEELTYKITNYGFDDGE